MVARIKRDMGFGFSIGLLREKKCAGGLLVGP
jgi:hypothetical protein